jgi:hypothetical protein
MGRHTISHAEELFSGEAYHPGAFNAQRGVALTPLVYCSPLSLVAPNFTAYLNAQTIPSGAVTMNGGLVSNSVGRADVSRGIRIVASGAATAILTFTGTDMYGDTVTEAIQLNGATPVFGLKAFNTVTGISSNGAVGGGVTINAGTADILVADVDCIAASQAQAATVTLNGACAYGSPAHAVFDCPRAIVIDADGATTNVATVTGKDIYGETMREAITFNGTTAVNGKKAFIRVDSITVAGTPDAVNVFIGTTNILGLPVKVLDNGLIMAVENELPKIDTLGTFVAGVTTTATTTTGDVRGTYLPNVTPTGVVSVCLLCYVHDRSTKVGAYGVTQA